MAESELDALAAQMFFDFSRMEYALKATGHLQQPNGNAEPDWVTYSNRIDADFRMLAASDDALREAVNGLLEHPPRKQVAVEGKLDWVAQDAKGASETERLLVYVRRVRNNLFHGGKFGATWFAPDRGMYLIPKCLVVLDGCRQVSGEVREAYYG